MDKPIKLPVSGCSGPFCRPRPIAAVAYVTALIASCVPADQSSEPLRADLPLHLEAHVEAAAVVGSEPTVVPGATVEWRFDDPRPEWTLADAEDGDPAATTLETVAGALRVTLAAPEDSGEPLRATIAVDVPQGQDTEWARAIVRARAGAGIRRFVVGGDTSIDRLQASSGELPFEHFGQPLIVVNDGTTQTYEAPFPTAEGNGP